ncbi:MAG: hypothetical protein QOH93_596 [Chloroflexia bacterium]|jgi:hypothetical protein|nr:hypothetical protein [Chloroflexia bacterium]
MPNIDIIVEPDLQRLFELPPCNIIQLPQPSPLSITLPTGGSLKAITDMSKGIPNDCSMTFNLLLQIAPLLASMECLLKILKLLKPLIDVVNGLPVPSPKVISDFAKAAVDLAPCLLIPTPLSLIPFVRDILCLILQMLRCLIGQLKTVIGVMGGLALQLNLAQEASNDELVDAIKCAQDNASISAATLGKSLQPITSILEMLAPVMGIAGVPTIQIPAIGSQTDLQSLQQTVQTLETLVITIQQIVDALGGCPE